MFLKKQTCVDCHFFTKIYHEGGHPVFGVTEEERNKTKSGDFSWAKEYCSLSCSCGVWDEGYDFNKNDRFKIIAETNRKDCCFFFKNRKGMFIPAAKAQQERELESKKVSKDRKFALSALVVAVLSLLVSYFAFAANIKWWPFAQP